MVQHKNVKVDLERRVRELERQNNRFREMEANQTKLVKENIHLSHLLNETRNKQQQMTEKMEKVLKLLYCMYTKTPLSKIMNASDTAAASRITNLPESNFSEICNFLQLDVPFTRQNRYYIIVGGLYMCTAYLC